MPGNLGGLYGVREPFSSMTARFAGWLTFLLFLVIALGSMNILAVERLFERFLLYLPNITGRRGTTSATCDLSPSLLKRALCGIN